MYCSGLDCLTIGIKYLIKLLFEIIIYMIPWWIIVLYILGIMCFIIDILNMKINRQNILFLFIKLIFLPFICFFKFIMFIFYWKI